MKTGFSFALAFLIAFTPDSARAEDAVLEEIEVKARKETRTETLEVREVRESAALDVGEALGSAGGVDKVRKGGIANDLVIRGLQRDDINVLIDGARLYGACPNRMDPPSFHLDYAEVDRVELRKGPYDVTQPGGLGGVVDLRTRRAGEGLRGELNLGSSNVRGVETSAVVSYGVEQADVLGGLAFKYALPYLSGDGRDFTEVEGNNYSEGGREGPAYNMKTGWLKAGWAPSRGQRLELSFSHQETDDVRYPFLLMDARFDDADRFNASYELSPGGRGLSRARAQVYFSQVRHDMTDENRCSAFLGTPTCSGELPRAYSMRTYAESATGGGKLEAAFSNAGESKVGVDLYVRNWDATTTRLRRMAPITGESYFDQASVPDVTSSDLGAYVEHRHPLGSAVVLTAGARLDVVWTRAAKDRNELYALYYGEQPLSKQDLLVSGNVQADWRISEPFSMFAGLGTSARPPDPQERYFALSSMQMTTPSGTTVKPGTVGNVGLTPARNTEVDLGAKYASSHMLLKAQLFNSWVDGYVIPVDLRAEGQPAIKSYANADAALYGGEASARLALPASLFLNLSLSYSRGQNLAGERPLPQMPPFGAAASLRYDRDVFFAELEGQGAARQSRVDPLLGEEPTAAWAILNVRAGYKYRGFRVLAGVQNAFDRNYHEHLSYLRDPFSSGVRVPEPGRTFHARLQQVF